MKLLLKIAVVSAIMLMACTDKRSSQNTDTTVTPAEKQEIIKDEKLTDELDKTKEEIDKTAEELDALLEEINK